MFNPSTIAHAAQLARLHESSKPPPTKPSNITYITWSKPSSSYTKPLITASPATNNPDATNSDKATVTRANKTFSITDMADRKAKGLCMFCDEPFTPGHQLKHRKHQLMMMEIDDDIPEQEENTTETTQEPEPVLTEVLQLSLQALMGTPNFQTMRVTGMHNKKLIHILLDTGSTHIFLDLDLAKKLGCKLDAVTPMNVTGGGGHKLSAPYACKGFEWQLQQATFVADVIVLPLGCYDLILGIQWLKSLGPILWDFEKLQMEFTTQERKFVLRGAKSPTIKLVNNKSYAQAVQQGAQMCFLTLEGTVPRFMLPSCNLLLTDEASTHSVEIQNLLAAYEDIFKEPEHLPPHRPGFDHRIPLKEGTETFNLRPYRYSAIQKKYY